MVAKLRARALEKVLREVLHELERAEVRITTDKGKGNRNSDLMQWFIRLSELNPHDLSIGDWSNLKYELLFICFRHSFRFPERRRADIFLNRYFANRNPLEIPKISKGDVQNLCKKIQGYLLAYRKKEILEAKLPALQVFFYPTSPHGTPWAKGFHSDDLTGAFNLVFFETLDNVGHLLGTCSECGRLFIADRRNQRYCTLRCQTRVASRKYLATPEDRVGKRGRPSHGRSGVIRYEVPSEGGSATVIAGSTSGTGSATITAGSTPKTSSSHTVTAERPSKRLRTTRKEAPPTL